MGGFVAPVVVCGALLALHVALPARRVTGYVTDPATGRPYAYRLNGPLALSAAVFDAGWVLARGANLQKYRFKRFPERPFLGIEPRAVSDERGRLLTSGFWGVSRHVNYLGEMLMSLGLALAPGHLGSVWPWLYAIFMIPFMLIRERADERRFAAKYGPLWDRYREGVPYRIIPRVY